jgi:hypothetical protein
MDIQTQIADLERTAAVHDATRAELRAAPWNRRKEAQIADLIRLAGECRRKAAVLRRTVGWDEVA